ncbi:MAG: hypothetical protein MZV70_72025 [Desulfobacterales bacterium]|nr:hypothetical protein [Desulfobacterales bacterium]
MRSAPPTCPGWAARRSHLRRLSQAGFRIPDFLCVTTEAYNAFLDGSGLAGAHPARTAP